MSCPKYENLFLLNFYQSKLTPYPTALPKVINDNTQIHLLCNTADVLIFSKRHAGHFSMWLKEL